MPAHWILGGLAALGQLTFFALIGIIILGLGSFINLSGVLHYFALAVAILLIVLGAFMLTGGTAHLLGFVQNLVDKYSTTEMDDRFTPKRNIPLGYRLLCSLNRLYRSGCNSFHRIFSAHRRHCDMDRPCRSDVVCESANDRSYYRRWIGTAAFHQYLEKVHRSNQGNRCLDDDDGRCRIDILPNSTRTNR